MSVPSSLLPPGARPRAGRLRFGTLRSQFSLVIFLLAFLPNIVLSLMAQPNVPPSSLVLWMLLAAGLCGMVGYMLSGTLLRTLSRLQGELERGDFAQPHREDPAEVLSLRAAFGSLLAHLRTEQGRRSAFMATLVHDLKTPLIATGHLTRALTTLPLSDAERREVGEQIQAETRRLLALVQQMADAHRFERGDVEVHKAPADLRALADDVARRAAPQAEARGLTMTVVGEGHAPVDAPVLERALTNLLDNALRYARTRVVLHVGPGGIEVCDDGPGLALPLSRLAQPFNAQPTTIAGEQYTAGTAGLGLFIARRIAEAHGGELRYRRSDVPPDPPPKSAEPSRPPAPPTTFTLALPEVLP